MHTVKTPRAGGTLNSGRAHASITEAVVYCAANGFTFVDPLKITSDLGVVTAKSLMARYIPRISMPHSGNQTACRIGVLGGWSVCQMGSSCPSSLSCDCQVHLSRSLLVGSSGHRSISLLLRLLKHPIKGFAKWPSQCFSKGSFHSVIKHSRAGGVDSNDIPFDPKMVHKWFKQRPPQALGLSRHDQTAEFTPFHTGLRAIALRLEAIATRLEAGHRS